MKRKAGTSSDTSTSAEDARNTPTSDGILSSQELASPNENARNHIQTGPYVNAPDTLTDSFIYKDL